MWSWRNPFLKGRVEKSSGTGTSMPQGTADRIAVKSEYTPRFSGFNNKAEKTLADQT
jgi:hypothetical protein